jgi:hypothetical protein
MSAVEQLDLGFGTTSSSAVRMLQPPQDSTPFLTVGQSDDGRGLGVAPPSLAGHLYKPAPPLLVGVAIAALRHPYQQYT